MGTRAHLVLGSIWRPRIRNMGRIANVKSQITLNTLYRYVRAMMTSVGTQCPFWF